MKKTIGFLLAVCVCVLTPSAARADDGGFWDMVWHWDTKFFGYGTDFHLLCLDDSGKKVEGCEEWFANFKNFYRPANSEHAFSEFEQIRHEINFRVSYMLSYGERFNDDFYPTTDLNANDTRKMHAVRLMGFYYYRVNKRWDVGAGAGVLPIFGEGVDTVARPIATLSSVHSLGGIWFLRLEESYMSGTVTGYGQHDTEKVVFSFKPQFNFNATIGFDFRRLGRLRGTPAVPPGQQAPPAQQTPPAEQNAR
jgi:hypothetical protein